MLSCVKLNSVVNDVVMAIAMCRYPDWVGEASKIAFMAHCQVAERSADGLESLYSLKGVAGARFRLKLAGTAWRWMESPRKLVPYSGNHQYGALLNGLLLADEDDAQLMVSELNDLVHFMRNTADEQVLLFPIDHRVAKVLSRFPSFMLDPLGTAANQEYILQMLLLCICMRM